MAESVTASPSESSLRFGPAEWGLSAVIAVVWGSSFLWISIAIDHVEAPVVPLGRNFFGVLALSFFPMARHGIERSDWGRIAVLSLVWMGIPFLLFPIAEETVSSAVTGMLNGGLPVIAVVVTALFVRRAPSPYRVAAVFVGFIGIAIISWSSISADDDGPTADVRVERLLKEVAAEYTVDEDGDFRLVYDIGGGAAGKIFCDGETRIRTAGRVGRTVRYRTRCRKA